MVDSADRLLWINRGTFAEPTSGQAAPYTIVHWDWNDALAKRERRDDSGLLQRLWFWMDGAGYLRKVTPTNDPNASPYFQASYSADGLRTSKDDTQGGVLQHHDFTWTPYGMLWSSNPDTLYTPGYGGRIGGIDNFFQVDWLGSTRYVTDSTGSTSLAAQSYDAWGQRDAQAPGSPNHPSDLQWAGAWGYQTEWSNGASEPGLRLEYLQQRYYDPALGRFISPDPLGFAAGTNLYEYADNDPVNGVDPLGLDDKRPLPGWAQGVVNGTTTVGAILGGLGGIGVGGGGGFVAGIVTGPGAIVTAGAGALELGAMGTAAGAGTGHAVGQALVGAYMYFAARASGGGSGGGSGCGKSPSEILRENMIDAGIEAPPDSAAHHIVAWDDSRAYLARKILDNFGIDINSAANGVFLPLKRAMQGTYHPALHTDLYYETVTNLLGLAESPGEAIETLAEIGQMLRSGNFPTKP